MRSAWAACAAAGSAALPNPIGPRVKGVSVLPGQTAVTRTPRRAYCSAICRVSPMTPALLAQ